MAGLFGLKILLLWAGIIGLASCQSAADSGSTTNTSAASPASTPPSNTTKPTDPQASTTQSQTSRPLTTPNNTVTPTTQATKQAPPPSQCSYNVAPITSGFRIDMMTSSTPGNYIINITEKGQNEPTVQSFSGTSHEIKHLKPCTEYELSVAYRDDAGNETLCTSTESKMKTTGMNNIKALIARLVVFIIASVALVVVVYKIYIPWHKKSRNDVNDDMMLEQTAIYVNVPQHQHRR